MPTLALFPATAGMNRGGQGTRCCGYSAPRSRGEQDQRTIFGIDIGRFIPAVAGNSELGQPARIVGAVHPRARGEQTLFN